MTNYSKGQIYLLSHNEFYYVGSTTKSLKERLKKHQKDFRSYYNGKRKTTISSFLILDKCFDCKIETLQKYECKTRKELTKKEGEFIRLYKDKYGDKCVNKVIAGRTDKEYYNDNKKHIDNYQQNYRNDNNFSINKKAREKYNLDKDKYKNQRSEYRNTIEYKENKHLYDKQRREYIKSWGKNNNLLSIHIFNNEL